MEIEQTQTVHAKIDCHKCKQVLTQYLGDPRVSEVVALFGHDKLFDFCIACSQEHIDTHQYDQRCECSAAIEVADGK